MLKEPLYLQIAQAIRDKIEKGSYAYGNKLPSERVLTDTYGVNRLTTRKAIQILVEEGLLISQQGRGTFVCKPKVATELDTIQSMSSFLLDSGLQPHTKVLNTVRRPAGYFFSTILGIPQDSEIFQIIRLRMGDGEAYALEYTTIPYDLIPDIERYDFSVVSLYDTYRQHDISNCKVRQALSIVHIRDPQASFLGSTPGELAFLSEETCYNTEGRVIEHTKSYSSGRKFTFSTTFV